MVKLINQFKAAIAVLALAIAPTASAITLTEWDGIHIMEAGVSAPSFFFGTVSVEEPYDYHKIILTGGPGQAATEQARWLVDAPERQDHDIVMLDLRGTGERTRLDCTVAPPDAPSRHRPLAPSHPGTRPLVRPSFRLR